MTVAATVAALSLQAQVVIKPSAGVNFTDFSKNQSNGEFSARPGYQVGGSVAFGKESIY